ncbi:NAD-dependent epimerase/dehydratase family protein [Foetidibacter luteolus]|uniref:NAD-dependent epimerase/dehydratase family protein n=1 Tax=Foetidibacter luteolus TaxID=2608880 RepID=UPI00129B6E4F|nr:NAD-dependent epimerase/dehydratase family protein [Foetidibacter luteolus]
MQLHTILGANGTIATELAPILLDNKEKVRLVSRNPKPVAGAETIAADMLNAQQVMDAVKGSSIVYMLVGIQYNSKIWQRDWPVIMCNVLEACKAANARFLFFDSVYPYGLVKGKMTEQTPINPCSKKGKIRAAIDKMVLNEIKAGRLTGIIARAADFYGPRCYDKSALSLLVFDKMQKKQTAQYMGKADLPHSYTYTPDAAKAMYLLAKTESAFNQTWHLPTASPALTGRQLVALAAQYMQVENKVKVIPSWLIKGLGFFNVMMRELGEMLYQSDYAYEFDSSKFEKAFNYKPTSYEEGIKATAEWFKQGNS